MSLAEVSDGYMYLHEYTSTGPIQRVNTRLDLVCTLDMYCRGSADS